jgi:hypothetical protein
MGLRSGLPGAKPQGWTENDDQMPGLPLEAPGSNRGPMDDSWDQSPVRPSVAGRDNSGKVADSPPFHSFETPMDSQGTPARAATGSARRLINFDNFLALDREPTPPTVGIARPTRTKREPVWHKDYEKDYESSSITAGR